MRLLVALHHIPCFFFFLICSAVMEFLCDLTYNVTMSRIHASVQGLVFQSVMRQDITFFDNNKPGLFLLISCRIVVRR